LVYKDLWHCYPIFVWKVARNLLFRKAKIKKSVFLQMKIKTSTSIGYIKHQKSIGKKTDENVTGR